MMKYPLTALSLALNVVIALLPFYWWSYGIDGLIVVKDSPFQLYVNLLGQDLTILEIVNLFLFAFRFYVITVSSIYLVYLYKGVRKTYGTVYYLSYLYVLDPVILYLAFNYVLPFLGYSTSYPFFIIGKERMELSYSNAQISATVFSYPTLAYWFSLASGIIYLASRVLKR
ncbi:MAG: hypothetical protein K1T65_05580 [Candidatus Aramenus sp.]|nr:hypothetical protein [Candidatus Aramenus sp.]